jgi:hypothetical protein
MVRATIFLTDLRSASGQSEVKKKKRPVGEPAARGIGVLEEQKLEVAIQRPALMGGERLPTAVQSPNPQ